MDKKSDLAALISHELRQADNFDRTELSGRRARNIEYYYGTISDLTAPPGRSQVVSRDVSDVVDWMLPPIMRTFTASGRIVEFEPETQKDEAYSKQSSEYIHYVTMKDNDGYGLLYDVNHDSLLHGYGVAKQYWDDTPTYETTEFSGLTIEALTLLVQDPDIEILSQEETETIIDGQPLTLYSVKAKRIKSRGRVVMEAVAPEDLLVSKNALCLEDARLIAQRQRLTRSELREMGYSKAKIDAIPGWHKNEDNEEKLARDENRVDSDDAGEEATETVEVFECYIRSDQDGDGVAEMIRAIYAGEGNDGSLLEWEEWEDDSPFDLIECKPVPHRFDALGMADDTRDLMRVKTALFRGMLDNIYGVNLPQPEIEEGSVLNMDSLVHKRFGQPIPKKRGSAPIIWSQIPFVGDKILAITDHVNQVIGRRTGVDRNTVALDPEALANQTATAAQKQSDSYYTKVEFVARNMAEGWRKFFRKTLKLVVKHQDIVRTIRLRDEWVQIDPRGWNADMDCTVNIGLGTGSRDRDMATLNAMLQTQMILADRLVATGLGVKAAELLPKIVMTMTRIGEAAGLRNADDYFPEFSEQDVMAIKQMASQPQEDPKITVEKQKAQIQAEAKKAELQIDMAKAQQDGQIAMQKNQQDAQIAQEKLAAENAIKREQMYFEIQLKREQLAAELALKEEQMRGELAIKERLGVHTANVNGAAKVSSSQVRMGGNPG